MNHECDFYGRPGLQAETYDARSNAPVLAGDIAFYTNMARETGGSARAVRAT